MRHVIAFACALIIPCISYAEEAAIRPAITGISHMTLYADDLSKSQHFYSALPGWQQMPPGDARSGIRFYANHEQHIELVSPRAMKMTDRLDEIGFATTDAEALRRFLAAHGVAVPPVVKAEEDGGRSFQVNDPEGNKVEFTETGPNTPKAPPASSVKVSDQIIHAGFVAHDRAKLDGFYKDLLGFRLYWQGGPAPGQTDWVMMQVPDGTDWLEYMLYLPATPSRGQLGSANHFSPGVVSVKELADHLKQRGWTPTGDQGKPLLGVDAKWQLDLTDPDGTRVEFMEFEPVKEPCCSSFTGPQPHPPTAW
jgi:catechol 2,3-dioxygenase-like lactoylglutathione lyase family enzyme